MRHVLRHKIDSLAGILGIPLTLWGIATIANQLGRGQRIIRNIDPTGLLVPDWRFFAPVPAEHEYHLLYRDQLIGGTETEWREINFGQRRSVLHLVWAPHRRREKGLFDAASELLRAAEEMDDFGVIKLSAAYLALLNVATFYPKHDPEAVRTQFLIIRAAEYEPSVIPDPLLLSDFHRLERSS